MEDLVAVVLHGPGLVAADMGGVGGQHRLIGPQKGGDGHLVGLGAAHQEVDGGPGGPAQLQKLLLRLPAQEVQAVALRALPVGPAQRVQYRRVRPGAVVVAKTEHRRIPRFHRLLAVYQTPGANARRGIHI